MGKGKGARDFKEFPFALYALSYEGPYHCLMIEVRN
jgi:hypothetical protein